MAKSNCGIWRNNEAISSNGNNIINKRINNNEIIK
jgi:hypothetical protein